MFANLELYQILVTIHLAVGQEIHKYIEYKKVPFQTIK